MAEYGSMFTVSGLATLLFFGGWNGPIPLMDLIGFSGSSIGFVAFIANLAGLINFLLKAIVGVTVMMWVRWTLPRLRIDQVMTTCLKYCVPLAAFCFVGTLVWQVLGLPSTGDLLGLGTHRPPYTVREAWVTAEADVPQLPPGEAR